MSNAFSNYANYAQGQGYNTGMANFQNMGYAQPNQVARPQMTNPLTDEQRKLLQQSEDAFDLKIKPEELARAICTHKDPATGTFATIPNPDGSVTCKICHQTFRPNDVDEEYVTRSVEGFLNTLQLLKMIGVDLNDEVIRQFFAIIPYVERVPKLYKLVNKIFNKYNNQSPVMPNTAGQNTMGLFNMLTNPAVPLGGMGYGGFNPYAGMGMPQATPFTNMQNNMVGGNPFYANPNPVPNQMPQYGGGFNPYAGMPPQQGAPMGQGAPTMNPPQQGTQQQNAQTPTQGETVTVDKPIQL